MEAQFNSNRMSIPFQKIQLYSAETLVLLEELRLIRLEIEELKSAVHSDKRSEKLFGEWIHEKELMKLTNHSRNTLYNLWKQGLVTKSTISGKANYYRMADFKKLLDKNQYR